ncbi:MAG TPA: hypothetical protein VG605_10155, partial [Puia sp.]|nr:hypothetical protein [Puia sp.]
EEQYNPYKFWFEEFKVKSFSDCFCFSVPLEFENGSKDYKQNLVAFYVWLKVFYNEMLAKGFLCRGGIAQGWHYIDEDIIFSRAQIDAYQTESKIANHPIIAIHESLVNGIQSEGMKETIYYKYMFAHDNAGRNFLHPFNYSIVDELFFGFRQGQPIQKDWDEQKELLTMYLSILETKISRDSGNSFVDKSQWLKEFILYTLDGKYCDKFYSGLSID